MVLVVEALRRTSKQVSYSKYSGNTKCLWAWTWRTFLLGAAFGMATASAVGSGVDLLTHSSLSWLIKQQLSQSAIFSDINR